MRIKFRISHLCPIDSYYISPPLKNGENWELRMNPRCINREKIKKIAAFLNENPPYFMKYPNLEMMVNHFHAAINQNDYTGGLRHYCHNWGEAEPIA
jgi:hypothetical protein